MTLTRWIILSSLVFASSTFAQAVPENAKKYLPLLKAEQQRYWPSLHQPSILAAQVEQESCISLKHSRCWNPRAELRTTRERGVGFGQITKTARFDALAELKAQYPKELAGWSWGSSSLYDPAYQMRALILMDLRNYKVIVGTKNQSERVAMTLASYNGGLGGLMSDRSVCSATPGCDRSVWFGHVEHTSRKSKAKSHGYGKSFFEINREYPVNVMFVRRPKYVPYMDAP